MADPFTSLTRGFLQTVDPAAVGSALAGPKPSTILQLYGVKQRQKALAIRAKQFKLDGMTALTNAFKQENPKLVRSSLAFLTPIIGGDPKKLKPFFDMVADMEVSQRMLMIGALQSDPSLTLESIGPMLETKAGRLELSKRMQDEAAKMQTSQALGRVVNSITRGGNKLTVSNLTTRADAADAVGDSRLATAIRGRAVLVGKQAKEAQELKFSASEEARGAKAAKEATTFSEERTTAAGEATIAAGTTEKLQQARIPPAAQMSRSTQIQEVALILSGITPDQHKYLSSVGRSLSKIKDKKVRIAAAESQRDILSSTDPMQTAIGNYIKNNPYLRGGAPPPAAQNQTTSAFMKFFDSLF
jgi:hypothetical protein